MADNFPNLTDIMSDIVGYQVKPRRHGHTMIRYMYACNTSKETLIILSENNGPYLSLSRIVFLGKRVLRS